MAFTTASARAYVVRSETDPMAAASVGVGCALAHGHAARVCPATFIGASRALRELVEFIGRVAPTRASVAISGESGTGKEMVARSLHGLSTRHDKRFVAVNCASIAPTLMESEMFGHERGAFTGADQRRPGVFEMAHGGTLFLDEVGEIPLELQAKLLRVLEENQLRRVGGQQDVEVDVRLVSATNKDLKAAVQRHEFREDLFFRLNVIQIPLTPLRERPEDVAPLVHHFVAHYAAQTQRRVPEVCHEAIASLSRYPWPGNVRELKNAVERAVILCDGGRIGLEHLPPDIAGRSATGGTFQLPYGLTLEEVERAYILHALSRSAGSRSELAHSLGVSEKTLYNKLRRYAGATHGSAEDSALLE
jgi:DNA-binding NtrC family response regulator